MGLIIIVHTYFVLFIPVPWTSSCFYPRPFYFIFKSHAFHYPPPIPSLPAPLLKSSFSFFPKAEDESLLSM